jgi:hypothetical protein
MIIWSGLGFLVPLIAFGFLLATQVALNALNGAGFYESHGWAKFLALTVAGIVVWLLGTYLHGRPAKTLVEKDTGKEVVFRKQHSLFFVPMRWWGLILPVAGLIFILKS